MGLGVTGVAATGTSPNAHAGSSIQQLLQDWAPDWTIAGTPAASGSAANPAEVQLPTEQASPGAPVPAQPQNIEPETAVPGKGPESARQNAGTEPAGRGNDTAPGKTKPDDGGGPGNAAGVTPGGAASRDAATQESDGPAEAATAAAAELDKAGKLAAGTLAEAANAAESPTSTLVPPALTEKTGTGNAGPGSIWLKKFNR